MVAAPATNLAAASRVFVVQVMSDSDLEMAKYSVLFDLGFSGLPTPSDSRFRRTKLILPTIAR